MGQRQPWLSLLLPLPAQTSLLQTLLRPFALLFLLLTSHHALALGPTCPALCTCSPTLTLTSTMTPAEANATTTGGGLAESGAVVLNQASCVSAGLVAMPIGLPTSLNSLDLSWNGLSRLTGLTLLRDLRSLNLSHNALKALTAHSFQSLVKVRLLDISFNELTDIQERTFRSLAAAEVVTLASNRLTFLTSEMLYGLSSVRTLNLSGNLIGELSNQTFVYLPRLRTLDLSHNRLEYLPADAFQGLAAVQTLLLNHNSLFTLGGGEFGGLTSLRRLDLSHNRLEALDTDTFHNVSRLSWLQLSFNNLSYVSPAFLPNASQVRSLSLRGNPLAAVEGGLFRSVAGLEELDLSQMAALQSLAFDAFAGLSSLERLNLSGNARLAFVHPHLLAPLTALSVLDLRGDNISLLSHVTFHHNPDLRTLYLARNPFHCGCGLAWILPRLSGQGSGGDDKHSPSVAVSDLDQVLCLRSNASSPPTLVPVSGAPQELLQCGNVSVVNVTERTYASIGSRLVLRCSYLAEDGVAAVLTWTTPRGLVFHYHPFHPAALSHLPRPPAAQQSPSWGDQPRYDSYDPDIGQRPDHVTLLSDGSLQVDFVLRTDAGRYRCRAHNAGGHSDEGVVRVLLDYGVLFRVKVMSLAVGLGCAATFFTLNAVYVVIVWVARRLVNKRRRQRITELLVSLDEYRSTQIARVRHNYRCQLSRIREHYHSQALRLKDNYASRAKRCSNQVERLRDNYHVRLGQLKAASAHQIAGIREATHTQIARIRDYGSLQMERLRETYKLQQQHVLKVIEAMNLDNCRTVVETECMRTESMIFDVPLPELDDDISNEDDETTSNEGASSQPGSVYATANNSDRSSQGSMVTVVDNVDPSPPHSPAHHTSQISPSSSDITPRSFYVGSLESPGGPLDLSELPRPASPGGLSQSSNRLFGLPDRPPSQCSSSYSADYGGLSDSGSSLSITSADCEGMVETASDFPLNLHAERETIV